MYSWSFIIFCFWTLSNNKVSSKLSDGFLISYPLRYTCEGINYKGITARNESFAESIANKFPKSEGGINAKNLLNQILHKELNLTSEKVNIPGEPFRTLVRYKNFSSLNFRIIELTPEFKKLINDGLYLIKHPVEQKLVV